MFAFLLSVTEVNCLLAIKHFYKQEKTSQYNFRTDLANELIFNKYLKKPIILEDESPSGKKRKR